MKKLLFAALFIAAALPTFAQQHRSDWEDDRRMTVTTNLFPLVTGAFLTGFGMEAGFEYAPVASASIKPSVRVITFNPVGFSGIDIDIDAPSVRFWLLRASLEGRWYPQNKYAKGWFLGGSLQFQTIGANASFNLDDEAISASQWFNMLSLFARAGYKVVFPSTSRVAFVMEPQVDLGWVLYSDIPRMPGVVDSTLHWFLGASLVRTSLLFGVAF